MTNRRPRYGFNSDRHGSHALILGWLGEGRGRRLLDVGAGEGWLSRPLAERGWRVTAIEADPDAAGIGTSACERMIVADLNRGVPDLDGRFDAIVCADILEHLIDPSAVLRALNGHLAPDGLVVVSVPNVAHLWVRLGLLAGRFGYTDRGILDRTHLRFFTERSLRGLLAEAGLDAIRHAATPVPLYQVVPPRWQGRWLDGVHATSAWVARRLPRLLGYQLLVLARRRS